MNVKCAKLVTQVKNTNAKQKCIIKSAKIGQTDVQ